MRCAVVGAGAWGTALAAVLARNGERVALWAREREVVESVNARHVNAMFLPDRELPRGVRADGDLAGVLDGAELVVLAAPSQVLRSVVRGAVTAFGRSVVVVVASKGIERDSLAVMTAVAEQELPGREVVALSGPSFAAEVASGQPTAIVAASSNPEAAGVVQRIFATPVFRVYSNVDVVGVELAGALKNVIAVAAGIAEGLGMGHNPRAALITRGLAEITRLGVAMGADPLTFAGLAGMGDLVLTATGGLSRNRTLGVALAEGQSFEEYRTTHRSVAEGANTSRAGAALGARMGIELPIIEQVCAVLFRGKPPREAITELMGRELKSEQWR